MLTADFDYHLPEEAIAQTPAEPRDHSRLLVLDRASDELLHRRFYQVGEFLRPGDLLVLNETRVIPARIFGRKIPSGGKVELLLLRRQDELTWEALVGGKGMKEGRQVSIDAAEASGGEPPFLPGAAAEASGGETPFLPGAAAELPPLQAEITAVLEGSRRQVRFDRPVEPYLAQVGHTPLPPYIHTPLRDPERYQTVYSRTPGSAAAPTAGLHFTPQLMEQLKQQGIEFAYVTLHVGLDTFAPVTEERPTEHVIHTEWRSLPAETAQAIRRTKARGGRVIALGTTSVRTLESSAQADGQVAACEGPTGLYILPGYTFRVVDAMITNFHLPKSTLIMLVSAFAGRARVLSAYETAVRAGYRFYSFGDAMLIY
jgi:S-adenosylmethionine:tRNA ribosyltransferase-isomerase